MLKGFVLAVFIFATLTTTVAQDLAVKYKPPFFPVSISYSTKSGFKVSVEQSISTPLGTIGFSVSEQLSKDEKGNVIIEDTKANQEKIVYIEVPRYITKEKIVVRKEVEYIDRTVPIKTPPIIKIREIEKEVIIEDKSYRIEIIRYKGNKTKTFIIKGLDVLNVEAEGNVKIQASEGKLVIDLKKAEVKKLMFRGGQLSPETVEDKIVKLCNHYNEKFGLNGNYYASSLITNEELKSNPELDHLRNLIESAVITDYDLVPLALHKNFLIVNKGIVLLLSNRSNINVDDCRCSKSPSPKLQLRYTFMDWSSFLTHEFSFDKQQKKAVISSNTKLSVNLLTERKERKKSLYQYKAFVLQNKKEKTKNGLKDIEFVQFLKELQATIINSVQ